MSFQIKPVDFISVGLEKSGNIASLKTPFFIRPVMFSGGEIPLTRPVFREERGRRWNGAARPAGFLGHKPRNFS